MLRGVGEVLAGSVVADLGIGDGTAGGDPAADFFDDLRDAGGWSWKVWATEPGGIVEDFDAFVDVDVARGGGLECGEGAGGVRFAVGIGFGRDGIRHNRNLRQKGPGARSQTLAAETESSPSMETCGHK